MKYKETIICTITVIGILMSTCNASEVTVKDNAVATKSQSDGSSNTGTKKSDNDKTPPGTKK